MGRIYLGQNFNNLKFDVINTENKKVEKGLSQNSIRDIMQDQNGFMWFGTWDGLNKYDGLRFAIFNQENGLSHQTILSIAQDSCGYIWIGTASGLNRYNPENGIIKKYFHRTDDTCSLASNQSTKYMLITTPMFGLQPIMV